MVGTLARSLFELSLWESEKDTPIYYIYARKTNCAYTGVFFLNDFA